MSAKLKEFITMLRECKTQSEEREYMLKEKSNIQESFLKNKHELRPRNLVKLLFINLQGFETEFAQIESLNIINRSSFLEKKIGYLTLSLFIHEKSEMLMMATNRLGMDLDCPHLFIKALALNCFASIADQDMCRSLSPKIVKLASGEFPRPKTKSQFISRAFSIGRTTQTQEDFTRASSNEDLRVLNVKKKALLAAKRVCEKCPDLIQDYYSAIDMAIKEKEHGVLLSALPLVEIICVDAIKNSNDKKKSKDFLFRIMKSLTSTAFNLIKNTNAEYEINKINDPFLIIEIFSIIKNIVTVILNDRRTLNKQGK